MENRTELRKIIVNSLLATKLIPFITSLGLLISLVVYMFGSDAAATTMDMLFYTSPMMVVWMLLMSKIHKLCIWHRLQCILPLTPLIVVCVDEFVYSLSSIAMYVNVGVCICIFIASLINAYKIFFCNGE